MFGPAIFDMLGVRLDTVPQGHKFEWPLIGGRFASADRRRCGRAAGRVVHDCAAISQAPKSLTGSYEFTAEAAASVIDLEGALRRDAADAVTSAMSNQLLLGNGDGDRAERDGLLQSPGGADRADRRNQLCAVRAHPGDRS